MTNPTMISAFSPGSTIGSYVPPTVYASSSTRPFTTADCGTLVTFSYSSATATLPNGGLGAGWSVDVQYTGTGTLVITPTTATIDGASSLTLATGQGVRIFTDNTNYYTERGAAGLIAEGTTDVLPVYTSNNALGTSGVVDNGTTVSIPTEQFSIGSSGSNAMCLGFFDNASNMLNLCNQSSGLDTTVYLFNALGSDDNTQFLTVGNGSGTPKLSFISPTVSMVTGAVSSTGSNFLTLRGGSSQPTISCGTGAGAGCVAAFQGSNSTNNGGFVEITTSSVAIATAPTSGGSSYVSGDEGKAFTINACSGTGGTITTVSAGAVTAVTATPVASSTCSTGTGKATTCSTCTGTGLTVHVTAVAVPATASTFFTVTFAGSVPSPGGCTVTPASAATAAIGTSMVPFITSVTAASFATKIGATAIDSGGDSYYWWYTLPLSRLRAGCGGE